MSYPPNTSHAEPRRSPAPTPAAGPADRPRTRTRRARAALLAVVAASALVLTGCTARAAEETPAAQHSGSATAAAPSVKSVTPASVVGQRVTIIGTDLQGVKKVAFGPSTVKVISASAGRVVAKAPAATDYQPAAVGVRLIGTTGKTVASKAGALEYTAAGGVAAQLQYALAHWQDYNTAEYGNLNPDGGDCANFVSQTLIARGWTMNDDWYSHDGGSDWSSAWGYVPAMDDYFAANASSLGLQELGFSQADRAKVALGDIAVFDWNDNGVPDHVEVVDRITKVNGTYKIELASHNDDYAYRDLDETITTQHPGATGHFWHVTR